MKNWREQLSELGIRNTGTGRQVCPFCKGERKKRNAKDLKLTYEADAVLYYCHHCEASGAVTMKDSVAGYVPKKKTYTRPIPLKTRSEKDKLYDYMKSRGISKDIVDAYGVDLTDDGRIVFPHYKNGELVNWKKRTFDKRFEQSPNGEQIIYGMDLVPTDTKELVWVEGEFDVLSFAEVGIPAVSVPQGGTQKNMDYIDNCFDWLDSFETFIIAVDNDKVGEQLKDNLIERLGKGKCKIVNWDRYEVEGKDANDFLQKGERGVLLDAVSLAQYIPNDNFDSTRKHRDEIYSMFRKEKGSGLSTGWENVDEIFKIETGRLMIVTGIPTRGKSFFADNLLFNLTKSDGWRHLLCSFESTLKTHFRMISQMAVKKSFDTGKNNPMCEADIEIAMNFYDEYFYRLSEDIHWDIDGILEAAEYAVRRYGIKTLTIDPYNKLKGDFGRREDKYIDSILSKLSAFAKKMNILVIFVAHPTKPKDQDEIPTMYSISGGASWYNMADYGVIIHRDRLKDEGKKLSTTTQVIVQKVKDESLGDPSGGQVELMYNVNEYRLTPNKMKPLSFRMKGLANAGKN